MRFNIDVHILTRQDHAQFSHRYTDICQYSCHFSVCGGIALGQVSLGSGELSVGAAELRNDNLGHFGICLRNINRIL